MHRSAGANSATQGGMIANMRRADSVTSRLLCWSCLIQSGLEEIEVHLECHNGPFHVFSLTCVPTLMLKTTQKAVVNLRPNTSATVVSALQQSGSGFLEQV